MRQPSSRGAILDEISFSAMAEYGSSLTFLTPCGVGGSVVSIGVPGSNEIVSDKETGCSRTTKSSGSSLRGVLRRVSMVGELGAALR